MQLPPFVVDREGVKSLADLEARSTIVVVEPIDGIDTEVGRSVPEDGSDEMTMVWLGRHVRVKEVLSPGDDTPLEAGSEILLVRDSFESVVVEDGVERAWTTPPGGAYPEGSGFAQPFDADAYVMGLVLADGPGAPPGSWSPISGPYGVMRLARSDNGAYEVVTTESSESLIEREHAGSDLDAVVRALADTESK